MKVKQIKIKVEEWSKVRDNPRQRDTAAHAKKSQRKNGHLVDYVETQSRVAAAELPDGTRYKLDGHTRSDLWDSELLTPPKILFCDLYMVDSIEAVIMLYGCFDNSNAAETAFDKLASAFNLHDVNHTSSIFKIGGTTTALKAIYCFKRTGFRSTNISDVVKIFKKSLNIIDKALFTHFNFPAPVLAAMILSVQRDGQDALNFWKDYDQDLGKKTPKKFDAAYCLRDFIRTSREQGSIPRGSIEACHKITPRIIAIYDKYGTMLTKTPQTKKNLDDVVFEYCPETIYKQLDRPRMEPVDDKQLDLLA